MRSDRLTVIPHLDPLRITDCSYYSLLYQRCSFTKQPCGGPVIVYRLCKKTPPHNPRVWVKCPSFVKPRKNTTMHMTTSIRGLGLGLQEMPTYHIHSGVRVCMEWKRIQQTQHLTVTWASARMTRNILSPRWGCSVCGVEGDNAKKKKQQLQNKWRRKRQPFGYSSIFSFFNFNVNGTATSSLTDSGQHTN